VEVASSGCVAVQAMPPPAPPPVPMCAIACAGPPMPTAMAVGRPTTPDVQPLSADPTGPVTTEWAGPFNEIEMATVHHSAEDALAAAHDDPVGT
jgi:hypothetical protein